jgi:hypothetical protein
MTLDELRAELRAILAEEEQWPIDWRKVEFLCLRTIGRLNTEPQPVYPHDVVYHFLDDSDIRENDTAYAERQRDMLRAWLGSAS